MLTEIVGLFILFNIWFRQFTENHHFPLFKKNRLILLNTNFRSQHQQNAQYIAVMSFLCWKKFVSIVSVCAYTSRWKRIIWKLTSEVGLPRMEDLVYARLSPRVFPDGGLNPRPASFLRCLGTVGRWRRPRCTVSAGSLTMWAGLWSSVTSVKTGFTAGT